MMFAAYLYILSFLGFHHRIPPYYSLMQYPGRKMRWSSTSVQRFVGKVQNGNVGLVCLRPQEHNWSATFLPARADGCNLWIGPEQPAHFPALAENVAPA
jgi:hypothetical protein